MLLTLRYRRLYRVAVSYTRLHLGDTKQSLRTTWGHLSLDDHGHGARGVECLDSGCEQFVQLLTLAFKAMPAQSSQNCIIISLDSARKSP